nr:upf0357 protein [Quercus suber]
MNGRSLTLHAINARLGLLCPLERSETRPCTLYNNRRLSTSPIMLLLYTLLFVFLLCATSKPHIQKLDFRYTFADYHLVLYATREKWRPLAPPIPYITAPGTIPEPLFRLQQRVSDYVNSFRYSALPQSMGFADDAEHGLHSTNFNLAENIEAGDSRTGLDEETKQEVYRLMKVRKVNFDEARRIWMEERFRKAGIGADGRPLDRKAVVFS